MEDFRRSTRAELLAAVTLLGNLKVIEGGDIPKEAADADPALFMKKVQYHRLMKVIHGSKDSP